MNPENSRLFTTCLLSQAIFGGDLKRQVSGFLTFQTMVAAVVGSKTKSGPTAQMRQPLAPIERGCVGDSEKHMVHMNRRIIKSRMLISVLARYLLTKLAALVPR